MSTFKVSTPFRSGSFYLELTTSEPLRPEHLFAARRYLFAELENMLSELGADVPDEQIALADTSEEKR